MTAPAVVDPLRLAARRRVLGGMLLTMGLVAMDATVVATVVPSIARDLGGFSLFPWILSAYVLTTAAVTPIYGRLADVYGRKPLLLVGVSFFLLGSLLCGLSWNMASLVVFRAIQGVGGGGVQPLVSTLAGDLYSVEERGRVQAWTAGVWAIAGLVGPTAGGLVAEYVSWRWIFFVNLPLGVAAIAVVSANLREPELPRVRHRLDVGGAALLVVGSALLITAILESGVVWAWLSVPGLTMPAIAVVALVLFVLHERRTPEPMLPSWLFSERRIVASAGATFVLGVLMIGAMTWIPTFCQAVLGLGPVGGGIVLGSMILGWCVSAAVSARVYLAIGFGRTAFIGTIVAAVGAALLAWLVGDMSSWAIAAGCVVLGGGLGLQSAALIVGVQSMVDWGRRGAATGLLMFTRLFGQAIGAGAFGAIGTATLARALAHAPHDVVTRVPSVNAASRAIGASGASIGPQAAAFVSHALEVAAQRVFIAMLGCAVIAIFVVRLTIPRQLTAPQTDAARET